MITATALISGCNSAKEEPQEFIGKQEVSLSSDLMTPEALWAMGRIGGVQPSPDGQKILYNVSYYSVKENKSHTVICLMNSDGSDNKMITKSPKSQGGAVWIDGGGKIAYLSGEDGVSSVWVMNADGTGARKIVAKDSAGVELEVEDFLFSPDGKKVILVSQIPYDGSVVLGKDKYSDLPKTTGRIVTDVMHKHWDEWVETIPHPFIADFDGGVFSNIKDILEGQMYECPSKPFGGSEQLAFSPDSRKVAYSCKKMTGLDYAISTDSDIFEYDIASGLTRNLCKPAGYERPQVRYDESLQNQDVNKQKVDSNVGYDTNPSYSPDGKKVSWLSLEREGYESDRNRLCILDIASGAKTYVTEKFESGVDDYIWADDSTLYFIGVWHGTTQIYRTDLNGDVCKVTEGVHDYGSLALSGGKLIAKRHSMMLPDDIYSVDIQSGDATQLSFENKHILDKLALGKVEERWTRTTDGKQMLSWVVYPPHFDPSKKYPTLLFCEGGPQSPVSQFWSYRWNFQIMAANGYIIIAPNRRGLPGFGMEWLEQISGDYAGQCMKDYLSAIDDIAKEPYVDKDHLGCVGASFGGFSVYWLAGNHDKRFKAFIAHDGIFNEMQQYVETEEMWFANWDLGGAFWRKDLKTAQNTFAHSPHMYVDKWDTPILCIHGEKDYRILASQGESAFNAARMRGIDAELLLYPDENHWVLKPQNGILWQRTFFEWLDKYLKVEQE
ncbi:MAG: S9 family peptidase [Bacteroidales bacterium]|nr:S9 family peptidase [Bacteroidales bacterium]